MKKFAFAFLLFLFFGCSSSVEQKRNAELVVTYNGKEVHRASPIYTSRNEFNRLVQHQENKYIIFSANWCSQCKILVKALEQSGHIDKVIILNVDEPWVVKLYAVTGFKVVPAMVVLNETNNLIKAFAGPSDIVMYLLINVDI